MPAPDLVPAARPSARVSVMFGEAGRILTLFADAMTRNHGPLFGAGLV